MATLETKDIHSTFTKKDLCKIIEKYNIDINIKNSRSEICKELLKYIETYNLEYLYETNIFKKLSIKEKDEVILIAKKIKSYVLSGCDNNKSLYNNTDEVIADGIYISQYGDISSVRKAITLLNESLDIKINLNISEKVQKVLNEKNQIKKDSVPKLQVKQGKFYVHF
tara:strand:+ start:285 stop:788 length:504 start_codon:yes stop_codon:yes gene_type:complete